MQEPNYLSQAPRRLASVHLVRARLTSSIFSITRQAHGIKHLLQSLMRDSLSSTVRLKLSRRRRLLSRRAVAEIASRVSSVAT